MSNTITYRHGLFFGPKGNRIYHTPESRAEMADKLADAFKIGRPKQDGADLTWLHDSGIPSQVPRPEKSAVAKWVDKYFGWDKV